MPSLTPLLAVRNRNLQRWVAIVCFIIFMIRKYLDGSLEGDIHWLFGGLSASTTSTWDEPIELPLFFRWVPPPLFGGLVAVVLCGAYDRNADALWQLSLIHI